MVKLVWLLCLVVNTVGFAANVAVCPADEVGMSAEKLALVEPAVQKLMDSGKIAGATVVVSRKGKTVMFETFGMMDREAGKPMGPDTILRFYSMSKPVTCVAAMMLCEQGKLGLDDPVSKYVPALAGLKVYSELGEPVEAMREMTVRDLMRHTSGLTYGYFGNTEVDKKYREANILDRANTLEVMAEKLGKIPLCYQPGTRWVYSVSVDVLGRVVEVASGQSLDRFFEQRIFQPLGMTDTGFHVPAEKVDRFAACYAPDGAGKLYVSDTPDKSQFTEKPKLFSGGGGLVSTAPDYLRFCLMLANKGQLDGKRLLRAETVEMMTRNQLPEGVTRGPADGFGLGFSVRIDDGIRNGEYGWGGIASTHFWISPRHDLVVVALSQRYPFSSQLEDAIKPIIYDAIVDGR